MSSQTNKPNYKPSSTYQYITIIRRKMILKINAGNDKDSLNVTLYRTQWKYMFDIKNMYYGAEFQIYICPSNNKVYG